MTTSQQCWLQARAAGTLCHISSLPGEFGIGNMGAPARSFIDWLTDCGFRYWQICPIGPTGFGDSPYQSFSSFAGNPYFIDLNPLVAAGLLEPADVEPLRSLSREQVDYGGLYERFWDVLHRAWTRFNASGSDQFEGCSFARFCADNRDWLEAYALFMGLKTLHGGRPWSEWDPVYRNFNTLEPEDLPSGVCASADVHRFTQFLFFHQWGQLQAYARERGISVIGDLPFFTSLDSADTWQFPEVFRLDEDGLPVAVAGVPPDYFSENGQFWGNPLYDWDYLKSTGYAWWVKRLAQAFSCCDVLRLDHFRAFDSYWEIPAGTMDARSGAMRDGPGSDFFEKVSAHLQNVPVIAEDLGYITEGVVQLRSEAGLPGMKILQFGYGHDDNNVNLPHFFHQDTVVYTGTHDNDTTCGWLAGLNGRDRRAVGDYYDLSPEVVSAWPLIRAAFASVSRLAVIPVQDLLDLGTEARFNRPGTAENNWRWRLTEEQFGELSKETCPRIRHLHDLFDRHGEGKQREYSAPSSNARTDGVGPS